MDVGEKGLTKNWSIGFLERQDPLLELLEDYWACAGGLVTGGELHGYALVRLDKLGTDPIYDGDWRYEWMPSLEMGGGRGTRT